MNRAVSGHRSPIHSPPLPAAARRGFLPSLTHVR